MTIKEVPDYPQINQPPVYRHAVERRLPDFKVGANWRVKRGGIDGWIAAQSSVETLVGEVGAKRDDKKA